MIGVVLDAVALLALARNERSIWAALKLAVAQGSDVIAPSTALARVWRGTGAQAQLAKALQFCVVASFDAVGGLGLRVEKMKKTANAAMPEAATGKP